MSKINQIPNQKGTITLQPFILYTTERETHLRIENRDHVRVDLHLKVRFYSRSPMSDKLIHTLLNHLSRYLVPIHRSDDAALLVTVLSLEQDLCYFAQRLKLIHKLGSIIPV